MNIISELQKVFIPFDDTFEIKDKISVFQLTYRIKNEQNITHGLLNDIFQTIPYDDDFIISIRIDNGDSIPIRNTQKDDINSFINELNRELSFTTDEEVIFKIEINKSDKNGEINIYSFENYVNFFEETSIDNLLSIFNKKLKNNNFLSFVFLEEDLPNFSTPNISWGYKKPQIQHPDYRNELVIENCHFSNFDSYSFNPNCFCLPDNSDIPSPISSKLLKMQTLFCITSLFDISSFEDNKLYYRLNGYKTFEGKIDIEKLQDTYAKTYLDIFNWVYDSESSISDKINLTRNILSLYLKKDDILITDEAYISIRSAYKTYLQKNVSEYIEVRKSIHDELSWISQKSGELVKDYLNSFQKSIFTILSFFISVLVLRVLNNNNFEDIFTKSPTILFIAFLFISLIFLVFSVFIVKQEEKRLERKYNNIKNRYSDLLTKDDIDKLLNNDEEFDYEINYIKSQTKYYTVLWIISIIILLFAVLYLSSIFDFKVIKECLQQHWHFTNVQSLLFKIFFPTASH